MLDHFGKAEIEALVASEGGPHISFYLPTHLTVIEGEQDSLRLKNFVQEAERQLTENWMRATEARDFLGPVAALVHDESFWLQRQPGLAIFLSQSHFAVYRLNLAFEERLSISRSYCIRPLIPVLQTEAHGFVLALSANKVNLYEVTEHTILPSTVSGLPENLEKTLNYTSVDRGQQTHSGASARQGKRAEVYHGQGGESDSHKEDLRHFYRAVDEAVCARLQDSEAPLILACVDSSFPIYREVQSYSALHREHISGNVEHLDLETLHQKAVPILQSEHRQRREKFAHKIREHLDTSAASEKVSEVIQASYHGRVRVLFFDERVVIQGRFDPALQLPIANVEGLKVEFSPYNTDLVEAAVEQTIRHRGEVYSVSSSEMPGQGPLAALFRY
jgi:hypothetical protein